ncbi:hypothetical protein C1H71_01330 [Iodobacter fluviatilis]|uniref:Uncharacterized protein n=1 Tax=Iodobacter fluviatilis TaxID=537 RepID=A0A7G3G522_9NEIS|nr:hypothetical protein C1H71_01330 [Iodobacter fluviatilis]
MIALVLILQKAARPQQAILCTKNAICMVIVLGSVDVSFAAAFGPVLGLNKEKMATWYEYHERFLTPCSPKNGLNPKG